MLNKIRGLLTPQLRNKVDYKEATKDCNNIAVMWLKNEAAGTRAFTPDVNDRDECYASLKIYSCALEESKIIQTKFVEVWRENGYWVYKTMLDNIGSRERASLLFVDMCHRSWMLRLSEDGDLWSNLDTLYYDDWLAKEMVKPGDGCRPGMTSFQLMMATFGNTGRGLENAGQSQAAAARAGSERAAPKTLTYSRQSKINIDRT